MAADKKTSKPLRWGNGPSEAERDKMIEVAIVDACSQSEQIVGFYTMFEDSLGLPFKTKMLGVKVTVERIELTNDDRIVGVSSRGRSKQCVPLLDLPFQAGPRRASTGSQRFDVRHEAGDDHVR